MVKTPLKIIGVQCRKKIHMRGFEVVWLTFYLSVPSNKTVLFKIFENSNYVTLVAKSVSEIIYNKNVPDVSVAITDLLQGK